MLRRWSVLQNSTDSLTLFFCQRHKALNGLHVLRICSSLLAPVITLVMAGFSNTHKCKLGHGLAAGVGDFIEPAHGVQLVLRQVLHVQE